jgi:hypothetical protein
VLDNYGMPAEDFNGKPVSMIVGFPCIPDFEQHPEWIPRWDACYVAAEGSLESLERQATMYRTVMRLLGLPQKPLLSYTAEAVFPNALTPTDIIGVQLYVTGNQGPNDLRALAASRLAPVAHRRVALICQAYDRNGQYAGDLDALQPVYAEIAEAHQNVEYILWFSDGRKGGTRDHEAIRRWHHATLAACGS